MIRSVLTLFKTLGQIVLLQKGPQDIPHSSLLFVFVTAMWFLVDIISVMLIDTYTSSVFSIDVILAVVALGIYAIIINAFGRSDRLKQCFTAILGCSILFSIVLSGAQLVFPLLLAEGEVSWAVQLIWFWSIPVEGHIIARTIERQWFIGFLIALAVLIAQLQLLTVLKSMLGPVS